MNSVTKIVGFGAVLGSVFVVALGVGAYVGPVTEPAAAHDDALGGTATGSEHDGHPANGTDDAAEELPGGLMTTQHGYALELAEPRAKAGPGQPISLVIADASGAPVTDYDVQHDKKLHLIVVRRDFTGFQHVHPTLAADGTWTAQADLEPGQWRIFADFKPSGAPALTLGTDLAVPGDTRVATPPAELRSSHVSGYDVTLTGDVVAGELSILDLSVSRNGRPVTDLEPYLGAYGHLVALRAGDLAYLHVHPVGEPGDGETLSGPEIGFEAEVPSAGVYHLYLDFKHDGVVRTAQFAVEASAVGDSGGASGASHEHGH